MRLNEINNDPNIYATDQEDKVVRKDARAIAAKLRRKADNQNPKEFLPNTARTSFIKWLGMDKPWTRNADQPRNSQPDLGPKVKWR